MPPHHTLSPLLLLLSLTSPSLAAPFLPILNTRNILSALSPSSSTTESLYQPVLDFDTDGCYNTAAISPSGETNTGLDSVLKCPASDCRDRARLDNNNVYSRKRCNNGWCAIMYEYYFEKDQAVCGSFLGGHRHDWENIVVFVDMRGGGSGGGGSGVGEVKRVAPSCHGKYEKATGEFRLLEGGGRVKMVYHKDGVGTHCFRTANEGDDQVENETGRWFTGGLVGWDHWPSGDLRQKMLSAWSGGVGPKLDDEFVDCLGRAAGDAVPGFRPDIDE